MRSYNRPISIEKYTGGTEAAYNSESRNVEGNWSEVWSGFCREVSSSSNEFWRTVRLDARIDKVLKTRWNPEINDLDCREHRIQFEGKTLYMTGNPTDETTEDREIVLTCTQYVEVLS